MSATVVPAGAIPGAVPEGKNHDLYDEAVADYVNNAGAGADSDDYFTAPVDDAPKTPPKHDYSLDSESDDETIDCRERCKRVSTCTCFDGKPLDLDDWDMLTFNEVGQDTAAKAFDQLQIAAILNPYYKKLLIIVFVGAIAQMCLSAAFWGDNAPAYLAAGIISVIGTIFGARGTRRLQNDLLKQDTNTGRGTKAQNLILLQFYSALFTVVVDVTFMMHDFLKGVLTHSITAVIMMLVSVLTMLVGARLVTFYEVGVSILLVLNFIFFLLSLALLFLSSYLYKLFG